MWTLYDPPAKTAKTDSLNAAECHQAARPDHCKAVKSTSQRLWFLVEPSSAHSCESGVRKAA
jgi:hypothetical protein